MPRRRGSPRRLHRPSRPRRRRARPNCRATGARRCSCPRPTSPCGPACPSSSPAARSAGPRSDLYERLREAARNRRRSSCCTTARPTPTATSTSATRSTRSSRTSSSTRSRMLGYDSNYVPGWDCHGLPIEWKIEEQLPRQGPQQGRGADQRVPRRVPRVRRSTGSTCSARSSSASASSATGRTPI